MVRILALFCAAITLVLAISGPSVAEQGIPNSVAEYRSWATKGPYKGWFRVEHLDVSGNAATVAKQVQAYMMQCIHGRSTGIQAVHQGLLKQHKGRVIDISVYTVKAEKAGNVHSVYGQKARMVNQKPIILFEPLVDVFPTGAGTAKVQIIRQINNGGVAKQIKAVAVGKAAKCVGLAM